MFMLALLLFHNCMACMLLWMYGLPCYVVGLVHVAGVGINNGENW